METQISAGPDDLVAVVTWIPGRVATAFQAEATTTVRRLLAAHPSTADPFDIASWDSAEMTPPYNANHLGDKNPWEVFDPLEDTVHGRKVACWIIDNLTDGGRKIVAQLLAHPQGVHTLDLADHAGYSADGISSAFRAIAGRFRSWAVRPFWDGNLETKGHHRGQKMDVDTDTDGFRVFTDVLSVRFPDLAG